jgi:serine/threonine-protein kinase mTOR
MLTACAGTVGPSAGNDDYADVTTFSTSRHMLAAEIGNRKAFIIDKWRKRIRGCLSSGKAAVSHWQRLINLRRMIAGEREDVDTWLDFTTLCRHSNNLSLAQRVIGLAVDGCISPIAAENPFENFFPASAPINPPMSPYRPSGGNHAPSPIPLYMRRSNSGYGSHGQGLSMLDTATATKGNPAIDPHALSVDCRIELEKLRLRWSMGQKVSAAEQLAKMTLQLSQYTQNSTVQSSVELSNVHLKCLLKLGDWKVRLNTPGTVLDRETRLAIIQLYSQATSVNPNSYQAWHEWGLSNHHAVLESSDQKLNTSASSDSAHLLRRRLRRPSVPVEYIRTFIVNALTGLFRAISLGTSKSCASIMQDMLCVLNFWFKYGEYQDVADVLQQGLQDAPLNSWLGVLPQLIARIHHPGDRARSLLHQLLGRLGTHHAQALMYPLSVALQSPRVDRKEAADALLDSLREHSATLIDQSVLVSQELIRIAILWDEEWYATLEDASRIYFGEGNVQGMLDMLLPLHEKIAQGPRSNSEISFSQSFGAELREAFLCLQNYQRIMSSKNKPIPTSGAGPAPKTSQITMSPEEAAIAGAWDFYIPIFKRIHQHKQITSLNLMNVSNELMKASNLDLAVPGTYTLHGEAVKIKAFRPHLIVIPSKQRPRKIRLLGHNGLEYVFLLKGHEDLRQDERAMQLFGLVNALLNYDRRTEDQDLAIQRYAVVPLSPLVGLVGWVPRCDTLHDLIRSYRDKKKIMLDVEHRLMLNLAPNVKMYESLTAIQRLEVFEYALNNTSGEDLHKILWHNSVSSESWVIRRGMYTKSLAVMSVVGYVLGLGDRHPSNLMLEKSTCNVLHIDFGDCFEVAMHRDKFPEKIPFRLTRMLVMAMEVSGIEGTFRLTCERVMKVMRENRDSLIAVLEAFVHDPLISWRLLNPNK